MPTARQILNELKWREDRDMTLVEVYYIHRGAPGDVNIIRGDEIEEVGQMFFEIETTERGPGAEDGRVRIPMHRIIRIAYDGEIIFSRPPAQQLEK